MDGGQHFIPLTGAMFSRSSLARAEMATDLAIPIVADGGWAALTLRRVAEAAKVTPQAIAAWFPSVGAMRTAVASRYGDRWIRERSYLARTRTRAGGPQVDAPTLSALVVALLPQTWAEEAFDGIWLSIVEAGRWDETIGPAVAAVQERERDLVRELLDGSEQPETDDLEARVELTLALVHGLRAAHVPTREGRTAERAAAVLAALGRA